MLRNYVYTVEPVCNDHHYDKINSLFVIYSVMCFNKDRRYQFTVANNVCLMELIQLALGHLDELQKAEKYPIWWSL